MQNFLAPKLRKMVAEVLLKPGLEEIRLRLERPLMIKGDQGYICVSEEGQPCRPDRSYLVSADDLQRTIQIITKNSWYAWEQELLGGYLTLPGGHRVGIGGKAVFANGVLKSVKDISSLNFRVAKEIIGCAGSVLNKVLLGPEQKILSTLIVSPPGCGKTTLLRDLTRQIANRGVQVAVIDERSEIAACYEGVPQLDVGFQSDILDGYSKEVGVNHALRGLSPQVVVTDEIGHQRDAWVLAELSRSGVKVIATCHGSSLSQVKAKNWAQSSMGVFETVVILSRRNGPGTIESVLRL